MKATELLKKQHKEVRDLFKRIESEERGDAKTELFEELATKLVGHDSGGQERLSPFQPRVPGLARIENKEA